VLYRIEQIPNFNLDVQLFQNLSPNTILKGLITLPFPPGKFPTPRQVGIIIPLGNEHIALVENDGGAHFNPRLGRLTLDFKSSFWSQYVLLFGGKQKQVHWMATMSIAHTRARAKSQGPKNGKAAECSGNL